MTRTLFLAGLLVSTATLASAQLVHVVVQGTVVQKFGGESWWAAEGTGEGALARLDLHYDASTPAQPVIAGDPYATYLPTDTSSNRWRLQFGTLDITGPLQSLAVSNSTLWAEFFDIATLSAVELEAMFASDPSPGFQLPVPPFPALAPRSPAAGETGYTSTFTFDTQSGWELEPGSIVVGIDSLTATAVGVPPSAAIPEPSTYALFAGAVLAAGVIMRRRRTRK